MDLQVILPKFDPIGVPRPFQCKADESASLVGRTFPPPPSRPMNQPAADMISLTAGAIPMILDGRLSLESEIQPVLQVLTTLLVPATNKICERYRIRLSDGSFSQQGILETQLNELVRSGRIQEGSIIKLENFSLSVAQNLPVIIIGELHVIRDRADPIGQPKPWNAPPMSRTSAPSHPMNLPATDMIFLTDGSIQKILDGSLSMEAEILPVLQVIAIGAHAIANQKIGEQYGICLSDGSFTHQGMLTMNQNELVRSGMIQEGYIVRLEEFFLSFVQNQPTIIIANLQVLLPKCDLIGVPRPFPWKVDGTASLIGRACTPSQYSQLDLNGYPFL